jgi:hypothetical protein
VQGSRGYTPTESDLVVVDEFTREPLAAVVSKSNTQSMHRFKRPSHSTGQLVDSEGLAQYREVLEFCFGTDPGVVAGTDNDWNPRASCADRPRESEPSHPGCASQHAWYAI